jgi:hypothetical protein
VEQEPVRSAKRAGALAPLLVGRRLHLLGAGRPKSLSGCVHVVGVEPKCVLACRVVRGREADSERLQLEERERCSPVFAVPTEYRPEAEG